jgi:hypothetical protein
MGRQLGKQGRCRSIMRRVREMERDDARWSSGFVLICTVSGHEYLRLGGFDSSGKFNPESNIQFLSMRSYLSIS